MKELKIKIYETTNHEEDAIREVKFVAEGCNYFFNAQHLFLKLTPVERCYFDFLAEHMTHENKIYLDRLKRKDFVAFFNNITSSKNAPSIEGLKKVEKKLKLLKLLIEIKGERNLKYLNPKYLYKGTPSERRKTLQHLADLAREGKIDLQSISDLPVKMIMPTD